ncbi:MULTISPECIES: ASCH domain-containing protein [Carnobacterium]|uniref:ASCH domain-containing protein n=1 Tax=Carnobacterium antarcticum TaxID=2126436 RepID=A0ABW4NQ42_9LACT|nr:ASCH domain-containing protein [Carnobacterium sp. CP1]ALV22519.1 hypothetical protein NY10_1930 [Carnobacterium sp. CP1]
MKAKQMWNNFIQLHPEYQDSAYSAWSYGAIPDQLAELTLKNIKTATTSAYELYALEDEPLPQVNELSIILDSNDNAICMTKTTKVYVVPLNEVSAEHAFKEGEGDRTLTYWRKEHIDFFTKIYQETNLRFSENIPVVCEEFEMIYN